MGGHNKSTMDVMFFCFEGAIVAIDVETFVRLLVDRPEEYITSAPRHDKKQEKQRARTTRSLCVPDVLLYVVLEKDRKTKED